MNTALETNQLKPNYLAAFGVWFRQTARPFVARWWIWFALIVSPVYLTYFFTQSSLEKRINRNLEKYERVNKEDIAESGTARGRYYRLGYNMANVAFVAVKNPLFALSSLLLLVALLQLHYQYIFRELFERDTLGQRIYWFLLLVSWLIVAAVLSFWFGKKASNEGYNWTFANGFMLLNLSYSLLISWGKSRRRQLALIQQRTQAELDALKAQVNPHFLFNSLNNIYGTAMLEESPRTAESIQQLSGIVRYVMEESRLQTTDVARELRFIDDYVELQRIRLPNQDTIDIRTTIDWDEKPAQIVPLLLNPLIENAFKYGISIQHPCFVHVNLRVQNGTLHLTTENSVLPRTELEKGTGLGLANVRQRLALAYPDKHKLTVEEKNNVFLVDLTINL